MKYNPNKLAHITLCVRTLLGKIMGKVQFENVAVFDCHILVNLNNFCTAVTGNDCKK